MADKVDEYENTPMPANKPPPGLGFSTADLKDDEENHAVPNAQLVDEDLKLSKYQLRRLESHIPDSMALYEQNSIVQFFILLVTCCVAFANLSLNFRMLDLYRQTEAAIIALNEATPISQSEANDLVNEYLTRSEEEYLCDAEYFNSTAFNPANLQSTVTTLRAVAEASTYLAVALFVPVHLIFKGISAFYMSTNDYTGTTGEQKHNHAAETKNILLQSMGEGQQKQKEPTKPVIKPKPVVMTRAHKDSMILENEDERSVRIFLRGESILFAWVQGFQDIPQGTLAILFIVLQRAIRGLYCYEQYQQNVVAFPLAYDQIDSTVYIQLALVALSAVWNIMILGARWLRYFHYRTVKFERKPRPFCQRLFVAFLWSLAYLLAVATPIFALIYTGIGDTIIGFQSDAVELQLFFVFMIIGLVCASFGFLLICCWWGTNCSEGLCVTCVVWEAFCVAAGACEFEWCELCDLCC